MFTQAELEEMIRVTGGVEVVHDGTETWGHFEEIDEEILNEHSPGAIARIERVIVATGIIDPKQDDGITVDGAERVVRLARRIKDGAETEILLTAVTA